jgi:hypothetical protein
MQYLYQGGVRIYFQIFTLILTFGRCVACKALRQASAHPLSVSRRANAVFAVAPLMEPASEGRKSSSLMMLAL